MTPLSPELSARIVQEAEANAKKRWPDKQNAHHLRHREYEVDAAITLATPYAARVEDLERWKREAILVLDPLMDYGWSKESQMPLGKSISEVILQRAKQFQQAKKALEEIRDYAESCNDMLNEASAGIISQMATKALSTWKEEGIDNTQTTDQ